MQAPLPSPMLPDTAEVAVLADYGAPLLQALARCETALPPGAGEGLVAALARIALALQADNPTRIRQQESWWGRLLGRDVDREAEGRALQSQLGVLALRAREQAQHLQQHVQLRAMAIAEHSAAATALDAWAELATSRLTQLDAAGRPRCHNGGITCDGWRRCVVWKPVNGSCCRTRTTCCCNASRASMMSCCRPGDRPHWPTRPPRALHWPARLPRCTPRSMTRLRPLRLDCAESAAAAYPLQGDRPMIQDSQSPGTLVPANTAVSTLDEGTLKALGTAHEDLPRIAEIRRELDDLRPSSLQVFGRDAASRTAAFSSQLLDQVRNRDLDASGEKLGEVVRIARSLKLDGVAQRSRCR
ncbi:toxic anion resistance protein [Stenotrophomonas sp. CD2]|nr:toxic anion resistance protein [Stenotrophomonas sp. CD2]